MARDGSGNYTRPGGTTAVTGQTITASLWETMMSDLESDANVDRPVAAGGTGASTAAGAQTNLGLDKTLGIIAGPTMITATDTSYSLDADVEHVEIWAIGAGGAGGGVDGSGGAGFDGAGGGSGGAGGAVFHLRADTTASTVSVTIGAGGAAVSGAHGGDGGDTVVVLDGVTYTAPGGGGGRSKFADAAFDAEGGAAGGIGTAAGAELHFRGHSGGPSHSKGTSAVFSYVGQGGFGGGGLYGRGGGVANIFSTTTALVTAGEAGHEYGAGGAGGILARSPSLTVAGGNGASGAVLLIQYGKTT